jgi:hypothetical protein
MCALSPDGKYLGIATENAEIKIYETGSMSLSKSYDRRSNNVLYGYRRGVLFSRDGAYAIGLGGNAEVWDISADSIICTMDFTPNIASVAELTDVVESPTGRVYAAYGDEGIAIYSLDEKRVVKIVNGSYHPDLSSNNICYDATGSSLFVGYDGYGIEKWNINNDSLEFLIPFNKPFVFDYSAESDILVCAQSGLISSQVVVYDVSQKQILSSWNIDGISRQIQYDAENAEVVIAADECAKYDVPSGAVVKSWYSESSSTFAYEEETKTMYIVDYIAVKNESDQDGNLGTERGFIDGYILTDIELYQDSILFVATTNSYPDIPIKAYNIRTGSYHDWYGSGSSYGENTYGVAVSKSGSFYARVGEVVSVYDAANNNLLYETDDDQFSSYRDAIIAPDDSFIAISTSSSKVQIADINTGAITASFLTGYVPKILSVSRDSKYVSTSSFRSHDNGRVDFWTVASNEQYTIPGRALTVFSPVDDSYIYVDCVNSELSLFEYSPNESIDNAIRRTSRSINDADIVVYISCSEDGRYIILTHGSGAVSVYRSTDLALIWEYIDDVSAPVQAIFSSDNMLLIVAEDVRRVVSVVNVPMNVLAVDSDLSAPSRTSISLFPNPTSNNLVVQIPGEISVVSLKIYDVLGRERISSSKYMSQGFVNMDVSILQPGCYYVLAEIDQRISSSDFIKIK